MLRAVIGLALCSLVHAATFTATQAGNWASISTWGGSGPPGNGDRAVISCNCTVTIPAATSVTVGDSPVAGTAVVTIAPAGVSTASTLINAGTLTLQGDMMLGPNNAASEQSIYTMQAGSITQFSSPAATAYRIVFSPQFNQKPWPLVQSTASSWSSPAIIQNIGGNVGNNGFIVGCCDSTLSLAFTKLINLGTSSVAGVSVGADLILNHILMVGSGSLKQAGAPPGFQSCIDYLDVRTPLMSPILYLGVNTPVTPSTCNRITNSVILASGTGAFAFMFNSGTTVTNSIFGLGGVNFAQASGVILQNVLMADPFGASIDNSIVAFPVNSGMLWDGGGNWTNETAFNMHTITESGAAAGAPNTVQNIVVDGGGLSTGSGDLWVSPGVHYVNRAITVNGAGNLEDGTGISATSFGFINHSTSENSDGGSGASTVNLNEFQANLNQLKQSTNILADRNYNALCIASSAAPYIQQISLNYDYNWLSNRKDPDPINAVSVRPWNASTNHQGTLCDNWVSGSGSGGANLSKATITVSTVTDASHLIVSSTTSVSVGDYLYHNASARGAFVTAVPSSGHVTIGNDEDGVPGIPAAIAGQSLVVLPDPWSSGIFGDAGKGQHEGYSDARLIDPNVSVETWDKANGGPGTRASARTEAYKMNGWDASGNAATFNPAYSIASYLAYIRHGLIPTSLLLKGFANDASWAALTAFVVGQSVLDTARHLQICTTAGTSGGSTPTWNDLGGTTGDGGVTWTDQGSGIDPGAVAITVYNSPGISGGSVN